MKAPLRVVVLSLLACLVSGRSVGHAATTTWTGGTSDWNTAANWNGGVPTTGVGAAFSGASGSTITLSSAGSAFSLSYTGTPGSYTIGSASGPTLTLASGGSITMASSVTNAETINAPIVVLGGISLTNSATTLGATLNLGGSITSGAASGTQTLSLGGSPANGTNVLSGAIGNGSTGGTVGVQVSGGTWKLSGANTYTGTTGLSAGGIVVGSDSALGSGTFSWGGGTLAAAGQHTISNGVTLNGTGTINGTGSLTLGGPLTLSGTSTINVTSSGRTVISGPVYLSNNTTTSRTLTLSVGGGANLLVSGAIADATSTSTAPSTLAVTFGGTNGVLELSGVNTFGSGKSVTVTGTGNGTIVFGNDAALGSASINLNSSNSATSPQITLLAADTKSADTLSVSGLTGQIVTNNVAVTTAGGVGGSGNLQFNGAVSGPLGNYGSGTTIYHGTYSGGSISGEGKGNVIFDASSSITAAFGFFFSDGNGTLTLGGAYTASGGLSLAGNVQLDVSNSLNHLGTGTLTLNGADLVLGNFLGTGGNNNQTVTTSTSLGAGHSSIARNADTTAVIDLKQIIPSVPYGDINFAAPNIAKVAPATSTTNGLLLGGSATVGGVDNANWAAMSGGYAVAYTGYTTLPASGAGSGVTNYLLTDGGATAGAFSANSLKIASTQAGGSLTLGGDLSLTTGALLYTGANNYTVNGSGGIGNGAGAFTVQQYGSGVLTLAGNVGIAGTTYFVKTGPGTVVLTGTSNAYTGLTYVNEGTLSISSDANLNPLTTGTLSSVTYVGGTSVAMSSQGVPSAKGFALGATVAGATVVGVASSSNGLTLASAANTSFANVVVVTASSSSNSVTVSSVPSDLQVGSYLLGQLITAISGNTVTLAGNANTTILAATNAQYFQAVTIASSSTSSKTVTLSSVPASLNVGSALLGSYVTAISGNTVTLAANANAAISSATTTAYSPVGTVSWTGDPGVVLNGGTLQATATFSLSTADATGTVYARPVVLGTDSGTVEVTGANVFTIPGIISGAGSLTKTGTGTLVLSGTNYYTGGTYVDAGTLAFGVNNSLANTAGQALTNPMVVEGGTLDVAGTSQFMGPVTLASGSIVDSVGGGRLTAYGYTMQSGTVSAVLADNGTNPAPLTKNTAGTVTLSGANTYTGATTVTAGTLLVNGSIAAGSIVSVAADGSVNAVIGGTGTIAGTMTVGGGAGTGASIVDAGTASTVGVLAIGGDLTLLTGATLRFEVDGGAGTIDRLNVAGTLTLGNGIAALSGSDLGTGALTVGTVLTLAQYGSLSGYFNGLADGATFSIGATTYEINYGTLVSGQITLDVVAAAVPEPSTWVLMLGGMAVVAATALRRRMTVAKA